MSQINKYIFFTLNEEIFAISVNQVISIEKMQYLTGIPRASNYIKGITDIRNITTAVIDLKSILEMQNSAETDDTRMIVVQINDMQVGFIVDNATEVRDLNENEIESAPLMLANSRDTYLHGVVKVDDRLVLILDLGEILSFSETNELRDLIEQEKSK